MTAQAAKKLMGLSNSWKQIGLKTKKADTSQHGNWSSFRNELFDGADGATFQTNSSFDTKPFRVDDTFFATWPHRGCMRFDFVQTLR
jgi:hypothetical protein